MLTHFVWWKQIVKNAIRPYCRCFWNFGVKFFESVRGAIFSNFCSIKRNVLCPGLSVFFFTHILFRVKKKTWSFRNNTFRFRVRNLKKSTMWFFLRLSYPSRPSRSLEHLQWIQFKSDLFVISNPLVYCIWCFRQLDTALHLQVFKTPKNILEIICSQCF